MGADGSERRKRAAPALLSSLYLLVAAWVLYPPQLPELRQAGEMKAIR